MTTSLKSALDEVFLDQPWGDQQSKSCQLIKSYLNANLPRHHQQVYRHDKHIIADNLQGQSWYRSLCFGVRTILEQLLEQMVIQDFTCHNLEGIKMLNLESNFSQFTLTVRYYQLVGDLITLQIFLSNSKRRAYLAYYVKGRVVGIPEHIREKMLVPESKEIAGIVGINEALVNVETLVSFFLEIVLYYDQTETIGVLPLMEGANLTVAAAASLGEEKVVASG